MEEFLYAHRAAREGRATGSLAEMAARLDFASLTELPLSINLPEIYRLSVITVYEERIRLWYLPEHTLISEEARRSAISPTQAFILQITRWTGVQSPMDGIMQQFGFTTEDLIDGRYYFREQTNTFYWAHGGNRLSLRLPNPSSGSHDAHMPSNITTGFTGNTVHDLLAFTETSTIDLDDDALITALIGDFYNLNFNLGVESGNFLTLEALAPISIPSGANINNFITMHHYSRFASFGHANDDFLGWYLDAGFTTPLMNLITTMPARDVTLYARWEQI